MVTTLGIIVILIFSLISNLFASKLFGVLTKEINPEFHDDFMDVIDIQLDELQRQGGYNCDGDWEVNSCSGWGLVYYKDGHISRDHIMRGENKAFNNDLYELAQALLIEEINVRNSNLALGHVRRATAGALGVRNPHPWVFYGDNGKQYSFAHNGSLNKNEIKNFIYIMDAEFLNENPPQTFPGYFDQYNNECGSNWFETDGWACVVDSEIYFFWLMLNIINSDYNIIEGINTALSHPQFNNMDGSKNFIFSDGDILIGYKSADDGEHPLHYIYPFDLAYDYSGAIQLIMTLPSTSGIPGSWIHSLNNNSLLMLSTEFEPVIIENINLLNGLEIKSFKKGVNWVGFPRLTNNNGVTTQSVLEPLLPYFASIKDINHNYYIYNDDAEWEGELNLINSTTGYKVRVYGQYDDYYLPIEGSRIVEDTELQLLPGDNWVPYLLTDSNYPGDVIPEYLLGNLNYILAKDWFLIERNEILIPKEDCPMQPVPENYEADCFTINYGDMVILNVDTEMTFQWQQSEIIREPFKKADVQHFDYIELSDYQPIIIETINGIEEIEEIGAFIGEECVGACKVNGLPIPLQAYTTSDKINDIQFQVVLKETLERNQNTNQPKRITTINQRIENGGVFVSLSTKPENKKLLIKGFALHHSYPNPFNPTTTINFSLNVDSYISIQIYDLNGKLIQDIISGYYSSGRYTVEWNGNDSNGTRVSSGLYIINLKSDNETFTKPVMLLK